MKNKNIIFIGICSIVLLFSSCYKDLGNYDYKEINELSVLGLENRYEVDQDDSLNINVNLEGTQYSDTTRFNFEWEVTRRIIGRYRDLHIKVGINIGEHLGRLVITDKETGAKAYFRFTMRVASSTAGDLIMALSKDNGRAELSYKRLDKEGDFVVNYYQDRFNKSLGRDPKKILINYNFLPGILPFGFPTTRGGLQILLENEWKVLDKNNLSPDTSIASIGPTSFTNYLPPYPTPDVSNFKPECVNYQIGMWNYNPYGSINQAGQMRMISDGGFYSVNMDSYTSVQVNGRASNNGRLSPAMCYASVQNAPLERPTLIPGGFKLSSYILLFDEVNGKFLASASGGYPAIIQDKKTGEYLPSFPGYKMLHATHTSIDNKCVVVLSNGTNTKLLYMHVPSDATAARTKPFAIEGELDVTSVLINKETKFYPLRYNPYLLFSTKDRVYRYNSLSIIEKVVPGQAIASLSDLGYGNNATIETFTVSRTEKNILLAVSNYGTDKEGTGEERKGDVVKLNFNSANIEAKLEKIYRGVSGFPVDIQIKYQTHYRDGLDKDNVLVDKI